MELKKIFGQHSAFILTCIAGAGVIATAISAAQGGMEVSELLAEARGGGEELTVKDKIAIATPVYFPAFMFGVATVTCIFGANAINKKQQASLLGAYTITKRSFEKYRQTLIEKHGIEADTEIRESIIARQHCDYHQIGLDVPDQKCIFIEPISGQVLKCYEREIMDAEYHLNRNFVLRGFVSLNEFWEFLGLPKTDRGAKTGWSIDSGFYWIDFEHRLLEDKKYLKHYTIEPVFPPDESYLEGWQ